MRADQPVVPLPLGLTPPCVFPDPRILAGSHRYQATVPFSAAVERSAWVGGVVSGLDRHGADWLSRLVVDHALTCRLIVVLYPACPTNGDVLNTLLRLQPASIESGSEPGKERGLQVRVLPLPASQWAAPNALCLVPRSAGDEPCVVIGSSPNFGIGRNDCADASAIFYAGPEILDSWRNWFEWVWAASVPLTEATVAIPALIPAPGTAEAADAWQAYLTMCRNVRAGARSVAPTASVDPQTGGVTVTDAAGGTARGPMDDLGIPRPDPLVSRISQIYRLGALVTIDKTSRVPPLDVPVKAELFGIRSFHQVGVGSRRTSYRFSVLDERDLRALETRRKAAGTLLSCFSFPLADGVRWMPHRAWPLFETELDHMDRAGSAALRETIGGDVKTFLAKRRERIAEAAKGLVQETQLGTVTASAVDQILAEAERRLNQALGGRLLPSVSFSPVEFRAARESKWTSLWGQAATLMLAIAEYPRKALTEPRFLAGVDHVDEDELLEAMDVCADVIRQTSVRARRRAKNDLQMLARLERSKLDGRQRCELILALIAGADAKELDRSIPEDGLGQG
jgi:hypothetical protein